MELPPTQNIPEEKNETPPPLYIKDSSLAVASLVTGMLGWTLVPLLGSIVAIITGHLAKKEIDESNGLLSGKSMASAGLIMGYIQLGFVVLIAITVITLIIIAGANW
jgi:hypothetical protein